jgi:hypothetical protein
MAGLVPAMTNFIDVSSVVKSQRFYCDEAASYSTPASWGVNS